MFPGKVQQEHSGVQLFAFEHGQPLRKDPLCGWQWVYLSGMRVVGRDGKIEFLSLSFRNNDLSF